MSRSTTSGACHTTYGLTFRASLLVSFPPPNQTFSQARRQLLGSPCLPRFSPCADGHCNCAPWQLNDLADMSEQPSNINLADLNVGDKPDLTMRSSSNNVPQDLHNISKPAQTDARPSGLLSLPSEILCEILILVSGPRSALSLALVCRYLRDALEPDAIWARWVNIHLPPSVPATSSTHRGLIEKCAKDSCRRCETVQDRGFLPGTATFCRHCRQDVLTERLRSQGLELPSDSALCTAYVDHGRPPLVANVVDTVKRLHISYTHSISTQLVDREKRLWNSNYVPLGNRYRYELSARQLFDDVITKHPEVASSAPKCKCGEPLLQSYLDNKLQRRSACFLSLNRSRTVFLTVSPGLPRPSQGGRFCLEERCRL